MPNKVYLSKDDRPGGGTVFLVTWESIEEYLRGYRKGHALHPDETCEFVISDDGISVYVEKTR